ncbi:phage integrase SAM-like domain-containing protein [Aquimarina hainanensis]|uniref:Phage integrase SAM-like domain-containing protein n=1 Tax=Aquimarina hainanensis TaxID=1578017 RepID=A0ABW5N753_9FLAO
MATFKILLYKSNKNSLGQYSISLRITKNRVPKYVHIDWIDEKHWDYKNNEVKSTHLNHLQINNKATNKLATAKNMITQFEVDGKDYDFSMLIKRLKGKKTGTSFFDLAKEYEDEFRRKKKIPTMNNAKYAAQRFRKYNKGKDITFEEITRKRIKEFIMFLELEGYKEGTIVNSLSFIRNMFNDAIDQELIKPELYPFRKKRKGKKIKMTPPESEKIGLDSDEIKRIERLNFEKGSKIWHTQKIFLFSFYLAGMRMSDALALLWNKIINNRLHYSMKKNGKYDSLLIPKQALDILEELKEYKTSPESPVFVFLEGTNFNDKEELFYAVKRAIASINYYLGRIRKLAKIKKKLSCHISRHSFGNISGGKIPIRSLQKLYRHSDLSTTANYQKNFDHKQTDEALQNVLNY